MDQYREKLKPNPRAKAGFISRLTFWWLLPLLRDGTRRDLATEDLYQVEECDESNGLSERMEGYWKEEQSRAKAKKGYKASYAWALWRCFGCEYIAVGMLAAVEECILRIGQPLSLGYLIRYFEGEDGYSELWMGWLSATGVVMGSVLYIFTHHPFFWGIQHIGMQIRIGSCSLLYRKSLRLSRAAMSQTTVGQMVNLLSNDVNRFDSSVIFLNYLWIGPLQLVIVTVLLWDMLGPSCMAGLILMVLYVPLQSWMGSVFSRLRLKTAHRTDERVRVMNEIVNAMRVIKMYAWELPFTKLVEEARKAEIDVIMHTNYYRAVNMSLFFSSAKIVVFLALLTYVLTGNVLTAEKVFVTSALINNVRLVMTLFFPFGIAMGSETLISCRRLQEFFELEELETNNRVQHEEQRPPLEKCGVELRNVSARWAADLTSDTLHDITASVKAGQLLAVIGPVGAGKGSLLQAILGELPIHSGSISVKGRIGYAPQEAWVFAGTVRQNILFGQEYNEKKYGEVIKVCGLESDMAQFPQGDSSLVGERGTALSGGQKARINLARAVYLDGDVLLLDDPLSAVDAVVGRHLFRRCIRTHLRAKAVILVTHQLQYLRAADNILVLKEGRCEAIGSYHQLVNSGLDFASLLSEEKDATGVSTSDSTGPPITGVVVSPSRLLRRRSSLSRHGSIRSRAGSFRRLGDTNPLLASSALSLTASITLDDQTQGLDDDTIEEIATAVTKRPSSPSEKKLAEGATAVTTKPGAEQRAIGTVSSKIYMKYFLNGGNWLLCLVLAFINVLAQVLFSATDYWLSYWSNGEQLRGYAVEAVNGTSTTDVPPPEPTVPPGYLDTTTNIIVYSALVAGLFVVSLVRTVLFFVMCMKSSRNLHNKMFAAVIKVPIKYFETHPIGQILNRFTKDMGQIDELLPASLFDYITIMLNFIGIIGVIAYLNYLLLIPTFLLAIIFVMLRRFYLASARDIKRLEGITRSPVFSHLSATLQGLTTIRAFGAQQDFIKDFDDHQDVHSSAWFLFLCTTRWFGICLDWISGLYIAIVTYSFMGYPDSLGGDIGLAISSAMMLSGMFQWGVRQSAEVENQMTSVERVIEFSKLQPEPPHITQYDKKLDADWPESGSVQFIDLSLQYDPSEPPVLKKLNFTINSGEKIGIVGRTGAGKSSLITCLFRLTEPTGQILIDNADISKMGLHKLRKNISIIPQDPTLFSGTFRKNLDPFSRHEDHELWHALEEVQLKEAVQESPGALEHILSEGGSNLSVGQRQLVCLARAILSHNPILLMDEATANVDPKTDALIQQTIREKFVECTVLTVAHRLHTIMDSTRVLVMSSGYLKEFDSPHLLLQDRNSIFSELVGQTGLSTSAHLRSLAANAYHSSNPGVRNDNSTAHKTFSVTVTSSDTHASVQTTNLKSSNSVTEMPLDDNCTRKSSKQDGDSESNSKHANLNNDSETVQNSHNSMSNNSESISSEDQNLHSSKVNEPVIQDFSEEVLNETLKQCHGGNGTLYEATEQSQSTETCENHSALGQRLSNSSNDQQTVPLKDQQSSQGQHPTDEGQHLTDREDADDNSEPTVDVRISSAQSHMSIDELTHL